MADAAVLKGAHVLKCAEDVLVAAEAERQSIQNTLGKAVQVDSITTRADSARGQGESVVPPHTHGSVSLTLSLNPCCQRLWFQRLKL